MKTYASDIIQTSIESFVSFSRNISESAKLITEHLESTGWHIDELLALSEKLDLRLKLVSKKNIEQRNQNSIILGMCENLKNNITKQGKLVANIIAQNPEPKYALEEINKINRACLEALEQALDTINNIIIEENKIILMDKFIEMRKCYQIKSIKILKELAGLSLKESQQTVSDSRSCLESGLKIANSLEGSNLQIETGDPDQINSLIVSSNVNWNRVIEINKIAESQREFVDRVNSFLRSLLEDAAVIRKKINNKHHLYEEYLQSVTVLTVLISIKFKRYLKIENILENMGSDCNALITYIKIACNDIRDLNRLNYDMADNSHFNNEIESETVKSSEIENESYLQLQEEIDTILELSSSQLANSNNAITIGMKIEKMLKDAVFDAPQPPGGGL